MDETKTKQELDLEKGLKFLFNKPLEKVHRYALQAISSCRSVTKGMPQTMIGPAYAQILQKVTKKYTKGEWKVLKTGELTLELEGDSDAA